jgi:hypothetical protein
MPLLDHFHPPLSERRSWESFHALWSAALVERLNQRILPARYFAEAQVHVGSRVEVDVGTFDEEPLAGHASDNGGIAVEVYVPPAATAVMPAVFPDEIEVQVFHSSGGSTLVGAVELISPGNKDRPETRRAFAAKCAAYLQMGIGLVIVDVVTDRQHNLHEELIDLLQQAGAFRFPHDCSLYAAAYRPARRDPGGDQIDMWLNPLVVGETLPTVPLGLRGGPTVPLELELTYNEVKSRSRL